MLYVEVEVRRSYQLCMVSQQVQLLLDWASMGGYEWSITVAGPRGITPLHLAALLPDHGAIAKLLTGGQPPWSRPGSFHAYQKLCYCSILCDTCAPQCDSHVND
jgi:hypothetical protein